MFKQLDTILVIEGNKEHKGFYVTHNIDYDFNIPYFSNFIGYSAIQIITKKNFKIIYNDYPTNSIGFLRMYSSKMVLIEKFIIGNDFNPYWKPFVECNLR